MTATEIIVLHTESLYRFRLPPRFSGVVLGTEDATRLIAEAQNLIEQLSEYREALARSDDLRKQRPGIETLKDIATKHGKNEKRPTPSPGPVLCFCL